jgi:AcrR family transcriptional regulator
MSSTKAKILAAALRQFNEMGTDAVTVRSVAEETGISHGNLCYHFKNIDALIEALYFELVDKVDRYAEQLRQLPMNLEQLYEQSEATLRIMYEYRFLLLDFVRINRRLPVIREHYRQLLALRRWQVLAALEKTVETGLMRKPWREDFHDQLTWQILVLGDAWITQAEILHDEKGEEIIQRYGRLFFGSIMPYLTEKGRKEYQALMAKRFRE